MLTSNPSSHLLASTNPIAFVVCASQNFHNTTITSTRILETNLQHFCTHINNEQTEINNIRSTNLPMDPLTDEEARIHNAATVCFTCEQPFTSDNYKVHHDCHITGKYIAPVCNNCNVQLKHRKTQRQVLHSSLYA